MPLFFSPRSLLCFRNRQPRVYIHADTSSGLGGYTRRTALRFPFSGDASCWEKRFASPTMTALISTSVHRFDPRNDTSPSFLTILGLIELTSYSMGVHNGICTLIYLHLAGQACICIRGRVIENEKKVTWLSTYSVFLAGFHSSGITPSPTISVLQGLNTSMPYGDDDQLGSSPRGLRHELSSKLGNQVL